jgi:ABC-type sugar transport system ATPase subunit
MSSELPEIIKVIDRTLVITEDGITGEFLRKDATLRENSKLCCYVKLEVHKL